MRPQQRIGSNVGGDVSHVATAHKQRIRGRCYAVNYLYKTPSTFFGILQAEKTEKGASGIQK